MHTQKGGVILHLLRLHVSETKERESRSKTYYWLTCYEETGEQTIMMMKQKLMMKTVKLEEKT